MRLKWCGYFSLAKKTIRIVVINWILFLLVLERGAFDSHTKKCNRFAFIPIDRVHGLGHRFSNIVMSYAFARIIRARPLLQLDSFEVPSYHGNYSWFTKFVGFNRESHLDLARFSNLRRMFVPAWDLSESLDSSCDIIYHSCENCCRNNVWCLIAKPSAFDSTEGSIRNIFRQTYAGRNHRTWSFDGYAECVSIAVHIRTGDINLRCGYSDSASMILSRLFHLFLFSCSTVIFFSHENAPIPSENCTRFERYDNTVHIDHD